MEGVGEIGRGRRGGEGGCGNEDVLRNEVQSVCQVVHTQCYHAFMVFIIVVVIIIISTCILVMLYHLCDEYSFHCEGVIWHTEVRLK